MPRLPPRAVVVVVVIDETRQLAFARDLVPERAQPPQAPLDEPVVPVRRRRRVVVVVVVVGTRVGTPSVGVPRRGAPEDVDGVGGVGGGGARVRVRSLERVVVEPPRTPRVVLFVFVLVFVRFSVRFSVRFLFPFPFLFLFVVVVVVVVEIGRASSRESGDLYV